MNKRIARKIYFQRLAMKKRPNKYLRLKADLKFKQWMSNNKYNHKWHKEAHREAILTCARWHIGQYKKLRYMRKYLGHNFIKYGGKLKKLS